MARDGLVVAVVGATGAVGAEILAVLGERAFPVSELRPLASPRSAGSELTWRGHDYTVAVAERASFEGVDVALFSAGGATSERLVPLAVEAGAVVIDNTSAFRMRPDVPLVVPEVNPDAIASHPGIIANPNCSTIQMVVALWPLHARARIKRIVVSTYQSASGAGRQAMEELRDQTVAMLNFREPPVDRHPRRLAFDCLPHIDRFEDDGYTREERKMIEETQKILAAPELRVTATCVRVPVFVGHAESVNVELHEPLSVTEARALLDAAPGVRVWGDGEHYPTAADAAGIDDVLVGRLRADPSVEHGLNLWVVADNLRKGAATNAVQIAELLRARGMIG